MSLFKKVMIIGLATMALGSAAMGEDGVGPLKKSDCPQVSDLQTPPPPAGAGGNAVLPGSNSNNPIAPDSTPADQHT